MNSNWLEITRLGESGFLLPIGMLLLVWLIVMRCFRPALIWMLAFGTGVALVVISKVLFLGWGIGVRALDFTGFSGHTMLAAAVFPTLAYLTLIRHAVRIRYAVVAAAVLLAVLVAVSRVVLGAHSISEVMSGFLLGSVVAIIFIGRGDHSPEAQVPAVLVLAALLLSGFVGAGKYAPSHHLIIEIALDLSGHQHAYRRDLWLAHPDFAPP